MLGRMIIVIAGFLFVNIPVNAQAQPELPGEFRLYEENDALNFFTERTDQYYTQGIRVENLYSSRESSADFLPGIPNEGLCLACGDDRGDGRRQRAVNTGWAIGQNIYTPAIITIAAPQPYDRPWAGMLYVSRIARFTFYDPQSGIERQDRIELSLGMVGSASLAGPIQILWHDWFNFDDPNGWDNQLRDEPIVQGRYETAARWQTRGGNADIIPRVRANLGNALISVEAEVTARIGWNLTGFGAMTIAGAMKQAEATPLRADASAGSGGLSGNVFLRAGMRVVAHNIFLDGNTFARNDIRIDRTPLVPEIAAGIELSLGCVRLAFQFVHRGSEFRGWRGRDAPPQQFGSINLTIIGRQPR